MFIAIMSKRKSTKTLTFQTKKPSIEKSEDEIIAVIGSGAQEHAICWKLSKSSRVKSIFAIPGNAGTHSCEKVTNLDILLNAKEKFRTLTSWLQQNKVGWVIVGDVNLLEADIANIIEIVCPNIWVFGPHAIGAKIETDKQWAKQFMKEHSIPTAAWRSFNDRYWAKAFIQSAKFERFVVKASGLVADGQGVIIADTAAEACEAVDKIAELGAAAETIIIEERLQGEEVSIPAFCDGGCAEVMLPVKVRKKLKDQDVGPNTGGMGAVCPFPVSEDHMKFIKEHIIQRMVTRFHNKFHKTEKTELFGIFCAEVMITADGIKVLGFKCTFGNLEAQVLIPLLDCDLFEIFEVMSLEDGFDSRDRTPVVWKEEMSCVGVVMASEDYPSMNTNSRVRTIDLSEYTPQPDVHLFHENTYINDEDFVVSQGGRMFTSVAVDTSFMGASVKAIDTIGQVHCDNIHYRTDIVSLGFPRNEPVLTEPEPTFNSDVIPSIGTSAQILDSGLRNRKSPVLIHACDSVGNKFDIAELFQNHTTIGQDLVATCVNGVLDRGAKPLYFQRYFSYGVLKPNIVKDVMSGTVAGCTRAGCVLTGEKTDVLPEFCKDDKYNLAGFLVGAVEKKKVLPQDITKGDKIFCLSSSGIHLNGHSLVRKIFGEYSPEQLEELKTVAPFSRSGKSYVEELLTPTAMYTNEVLPLVEKGLIKAFIPISDDGLVASISSIIPPHHKVELDALKWKIPPIFGWIKDMGCIKEQEMLNSFNCGVGAVVIVAPDPMKVHEVFGTLDTKVIGEIVEIEDETSEESPVRVKNWRKALSKVVYDSPDYKRVAVVISRPCSFYLKDLIESARKDPASPAKIVLVIVTDEKFPEKEIAESYGIPVKAIKIKGMVAKNRDKTIMKALNDPENPIDIICFIGFTDLLCPDFVNKFKGQIINIQHSLPPAFDDESHEKHAIQAGMKFTGCTVHFAQAEVRAGQRSPLDIIDQRIVPVYPNDDNETTLRERIREQGREIFPRALKWVALGKVEPKNTLAALDIGGPSTSQGIPKVVVDEPSSDESGDMEY